MNLANVNAGRQRYGNLEEEMAVRSAGVKESPETVLRSLIAKCDPADQALIRSLRTAVRKRLPTVNEMVYDYPGNLVISYTPTELGKDGIVSTAARTGDVRLYFGQGKHLPDPKKLLKGSANVRFIQVESARQVANPDVEALFAAAIARAAVRPSATGRGTLIIQKSGSSKKKTKPAK
jgi:hypothetical protein